MILYHIVKYFQ